MKSRLTYFNHFETEGVEDSLNKLNLNENVILSNFYWINMIVKELSTQCY